MLAKPLLVIDDIGMIGDNEFDSLHCESWKNFFCGDFLFIHFINNPQSQHCMVIYRAI
jgi:hypothetical protein